MAKKERALKCQITRHSRRGICSQRDGIFYTKRIRAWAFGGSHGKKMEIKRRASSRWQDVYWKTAPVTFTVRWERKKFTLKRLWGKLPISNQGTNWKTTLPWEYVAIGQCPGESAIQIHTIVLVLNVSSRKFCIMSSQVGDDPRHGAEANASHPLNPDLRALPEWILSNMRFQSKISHVRRHETRNHVWEPIEHVGKKQTKDIKMDFMKAKH